MAARIITPKQYENILQTLKCHPVDYGDLTLPIIGGARERWLTQAHVEIWEEQNQEESKVAHAPLDAEDVLTSDWAHLSDEVQEFARLNCELSIRQYHLPTEGQDFTMREAQIALRRTIRDEITGAVLEAVREAVQAECGFDILSDWYVIEKV